MRRMGYRMELDRDERYLIANVDSVEHFDELVCCDNDWPPIRVQNVPYVDGHEELKGDLYSMIQLSDAGFGVPDFMNDYETREENLHKALYGESKDWRPVGIMVDDVGASIAFVYKNGLGSDIMEIFPVMDECIKLLIEVDRPNGDIEKYHLYMEGGASGGLILVTEYYSWGYREMYFKCRSGIPQHPDKNYFYINVIEHRK